MMLGQHSIALDEKNMDIDLQLADVIDLLIKGDYTVEVPEDNELARRFNVLAAKLRDRGSESINRIVKLSIEANETSILSAKLLSDLRTVDQQAQGIASAAEEMTATTNEIEQSGNRIAQQAQSAAENASNGNEIAQSARSSMSAIVETVDTSTNRIQTLTDFSAQITAISASIKKVADNTNLLAINAAIEAARAGDAGKGFAVVAEEVKRLANETSAATVQVNELTQNLTSETQEILKGMADCKDAVSQGENAIEDVSRSVAEMATSIDVVRQQSEHIEGALSEQKIAAQSVSRGVATIATRSSQSVDAISKINEAMDRVAAIIVQQIDAFAVLELPQKVVKLAQSDHVIWKKNLANMVAGRSGLNADELANHHMCRLGKWYDNVADPGLKSHPAFSALAAPHEAVHKNGILAVQLYNSGDVDGALSAIDRVEEASKDVLRLLQALANQ